MVIRSVKYTFAVIEGFLMLALVAIAVDAWLYSWLTGFVVSFVVAPLIAAVSVAIAETWSEW